jgi:hypothetical protein
MPFQLTPPAQATFIISVVLAAAAVVIRYAGIEIPVIHSHGFIVLLLGYLVLLGGNVLRGV